MNYRKHPQLIALATAAIAFGGALATGTAAAADKAAPTAGVRAQYERDIAWCRSGQSTEDVTTCLKEAAAAYDEAKWQAQGRSESPRATLQPKPAVADPNGKATRCDQLAAEARDACQALMTGQPAS
jgi:hypothetical protein